MWRVLPPTNQTCLATNQVVAGCEKLLQNIEGGSTFLKQKSVHVVRFTGMHKANLFCSKRRNYREWRESRVILVSKQDVK